MIRSWPAWLWSAVVVELLQVGCQLNLQATCARRRVCFEQDGDMLAVISREAGGSYDVKQTSRKTLSRSGACGPPKAYPR